MRDRLAHRRLGFFGRDDAMRSDPSQHPVARGAGRLGRAVRPPGFGGLRQRDKKGRLGEGEPFRLLAEIRERRCAHAFEIAAEGREHEIAVEHALLADCALDFERARGLAELRGERALGARLDQPRDLHRERRAAGDHMAMRQPLSPGAQQRARVDSGMIVEAPVLVGDQHRDIAGIDIVDRRRKAPDSVPHREGAQEASVAVEHHGRAFAGGHEIEGRETLDVTRPDEMPACARRGEERDDGERDDGGAASPLWRR